MKSIKNIITHLFLFILFFLFLTGNSFTCEAKSAKSKGEIIEGTELWNAFLDSIGNDSYFSLPLCDTEYSEDYFQNYFSLTRDCFAAFPKRFPDYLVIDDISNFSLQQDNDAHYLLSVKGKDYDSGKNISLLLDLSNKKILKYDKSIYPTTDYTNIYFTTAISVKSVIASICNAYEYIGTDFNEGSFTLVEIPGYGFYYLICGGYYHKNQQFDRVDALVDPFTGEIQASSRMPYSSF